MKTIATTIFLILLNLQCFLAQNNDISSEHLAFKGVPIDGTLNEYIVKMKKVGFTHILTEEGTAILRGDFAGYKNCGIGVSTLKQKDLVSKIAVVFPESDTWSNLSSNYINLKELLTEKYGEPTKVVEEFQTEYQPTDDNSKMHHLRMERCSYYSIFSTEHGDIQLSIDHDGVLSCFVRLSYFDKVNSEIIRKKALDDL